MKSNQDQNNTKVKIKTKLNKTENLKKVESSIKSILPENKQITREDDYLEICGEIELLDRIRDLIHSTNSEDIAEVVLNSNKTDEQLLFYINKQAAYNQKFHLSDESLAPLGDIEVLIKTQNPDNIISWIMT